MSVQFRVLGPLVALREGVAVTPSSAKQRLLLAVLLARRNQVVSVDALVDALWGDDPPATATGVLQNYVSRLRKALEPDLGKGDPPRLLMTVDPGYRLDVADEDLDAARFERSVADARNALHERRPGRAAELLREGLGLWRGDAFAGFSDDEPMHTESIHLAELRSLAIEERIEADIALGRHAGLVGELSRLVKIHPLRERLWGQLMVCLYRAGRQADALEAFHHLRRNLRDELGIDPSPELVRLERDILNHDASLDPAPPPRTATGGTIVDLPSGDEGLPFVGRQTELEQLRTWWDEGAGVLAIVSGEAGVGKTRLASAFAQEVKAQCSAVLYGRVIEDAGSSYEPVLGALRGFVLGAGDDELAALGETGIAALARLLPEMAERRPEIAARTASWPDIDRSWLLGAVAAGFSDPDRPPILVVLDDLQWADRPALLLLGSLLAEGTRLRIIATTREPAGTATPHLRDLLTRLRRDGTPPRRIPLGGLSRGDVLDLVGALAGQELSLAGRALAADLHRRTEGNSYFLRETLRHLTDTGAISPAEGRWASEGPLEALGVPAGVKDVVGQRLSRLSDATADALRAAAVVGEEFDVDVVSGLTGASDEEVVDALDEALVAGLVGEDPARPDAYGFVHALVREVLLSDLSRSRRARLEWRTGEVLESLRSDAYAGEISRHLVEGATVGDASKAVSWSFRAGVRAMDRLAYEEAIGYYEDALRCLDLARETGDADRADLLIALGRASVAAGDPARWRPACLEAASLARRLGDPERLSRAALTLLGTLGPGDVEDEVVELLEEAAAALRSAGGSSRERLRRLAEVLARLADYLNNIEGDRAVALAEEGLETARRSGDERVLAVALMSSTSIQTLQRDDHLDRLQEADRLADLVGDPEVVLSVQTQLMSWALSWTDRDEFDRRLDAYTRVAETTRAPTHLVLSEIDQAGAAALDGRYEEARERFRGALRRSRGLGDPSHLGYVLIGLFPVGRELSLLNVDAARRAAAASPSVPLPRVTFIRTLCEVGELEEAAARLKGILDDPGPVRSGFLRRSSLGLLAEIVELLGDADAAARVHGWLVEEPAYGDSVIVGPHAYLGAVRRYLGLLSMTLRRHDEAVAHHEAALDVHERLRARGWAARSRYDLGRALLARDAVGDLSRAREAIDACVAGAEELGMPRLLSEVGEIEDV